MFIDNEHYYGIMFTMNEQKKIDKSLLKQVVLDQAQVFQNMPRGVKRGKLQGLKKALSSSQIVVIQGVRRCGKSTLLAQCSDEFKPDDFHYLSFEDERLVSFNVSQFNQLLEVFFEVNGQRSYFMFDEIQVVEHWERFIRRLHDAGNKIIITGSNANLLSQELGTKLTGRHLDIELFPFSFDEYLKLRNYQFSKNDLLATDKRAELQKHFNDFLVDGGLPIYLKTKDRNILTSLYEDIIMRDILQRYQIDNPKLFRELALYLVSNTTSSISYNKLKEYFQLGSTNTVIKYLGYLENSYFMFSVNTFSGSFKKQINSPKKIYNICNAFIDKVGFHLSDNQGVLLENLVFLKLREQYENIFYYKTSNGLEVDFLVYDTPKLPQLIQACFSLADPKTKEREVNALSKAMDEINCKQGLIITQSSSDTIKVGGKEILVIPAFEWLLNFFR